MATNQQRREAAKRKLERQIARRAERAKRRRVIGVGVTLGAVLVVAGLVVWIVTANQGDSADAAAPNSSETSAAPSSSAPIQIPTERTALVKRPKALPNPTKCDYPKDTKEAPAKAATLPPANDVSSTGTVTVTMKSTAGDIGLDLDRSVAPCTVNSFVSLAKQGYFTGTSCHRLGTQQGLQILQCGDPKGDGSGGPGYTIADENYPELKYGRGILAMAKTSAPNSGGSQFFMVYGDTQLPPDYTVFGTISDAGLKVLDEVARAGVNPESAAQSQAGDGTGAPTKEVKFSATEVS